VEIGSLEISAALPGQLAPDPDELARLTSQTAE